MVSKVDLRTNDTRKRVIEEAKRMFLEGGYNHLSMDKISEILGLKRPTLYYHFPGGKEQLLVETIRTFANELITAWREAITTGDSARSRLRNILDTVSTHPLPENKRTFVIELWQLGEEVRTAVADIYQQIFTLLSEVLEEGIEKGEIRPVELELAIHSFLGLCDQIENTIMAKQFFAELSPIVNRFEQKDLVDKMFDMWLHGMAVSSS
ncbi:MAG TPA: TetR/AcrR family transcriptional regulator [Chloroflexia bacterium]|nr:TetR/AcrR family transcriptional regulator [Chloroflexia bacterium]